MTTTWGNGGTLNFYRSGDGCSNTGEIAAIFLHEFGHGLDQNTNGTPPEPGSGRAKAWGIAFGTVLVLALNFVRLVALFWIGVRLPEAFDFAHRVVGEAGMLLAVVVFWIIWLRLARR